MYGPNDAKCELHRLSPRKPAAVILTCVFFSALWWNWQIRWIIYFELNLQCLFCLHRHTGVKSVVTIYLCLSIVWSDRRVEDGRLDVQAGPTRSTSSWPSSAGHGHRHHSQVTFMPGVGRWSSPPTLWQIWLDAHIESLSSSWGGSSRKCKQLQLLWL